MNQKPAFQQWMCKQFHEDRVLIATYLFTMLYENGSQCDLVWDLMEQTGDVTYSRNSFLKAADIVLS